ncbi:MAG TPA: hypothetical protein VE650_06380 [Acetobacteraceae bacterium]|nr:hypothetical protein [Acetobacteraceae bacterium]
MRHDETDNTVRLKGPRAGERSFARFWPYAAGAVVLACLAAGGAFWSLRPAQAPAPAPIQAPAAVVQPARPAPVAVAPVVPAPAQPPLPRLASEAEILADSPDRLALYRFGPYPAVVVLQFPSLAQQGQMLNRVAALIEKQGFPRDRVLPDAELQAAIIASGATPDTFYYGHDYRSADLIRFFALAPDDVLNPEERRLRTLVTELGWREQGRLGALVSLVRETAGPELDAAARATILRHELSHGVYFTEPAYAAYCLRFWNEVLTPPERARFTAYLAKEGYDPAEADLIVNETQAYLMHTRDRRFFNPTELGLSAARVDELRQLFVAGMPPGWLRDATAATQNPLIPVRAQ